MHERIRDTLVRIEAENDVKVLYACESGSRAWGFPSADSDYDVRFIYLHPTDWYLAIDLERRRDVIELPIDDNLDVNGWDLRKALQLYRKSNPPLLEWLGSPIIYLEQYSVANKLRDLAPHCYSPIASMYHYWHMAEGNYRDYLKGDQIWIKKYFYVLRPILAIKWLEADKGVVPTEFHKLVDGILEDGQLKAAIATLIAAKRSGDELDRGPRIPVISRFLQDEIQRLSAQEFDHQVRKYPIEKLNVVFRDTLNEVWE